jgi:UMF1 family MFS transporter
MLGKFSSVLGPFLMGWVSFATGNPRYSLFAIMVLFVCGAAVLYFVDEEAGRRAVREVAGP